MPDEWSAGKLDLDSYLRRIGHPAAVPTPSEETLTALHRAHLAAIPFENLDILLGRPVRVDLESIQDKLVRGRRGGYCFEHGLLFGAALERIGFSVDRLLARVSRPGGTGSGSAVLPRTHLTLRVRTPDRLGPWLSDVGFGSSPPGPLSLRRLRSGGPQVLDGWVYEVAPDAVPDSGVWELREAQGPDWVTLYRFDDQPVYPADIVMGNHYTSTHPDSWFTRRPVVVRRSPDAVTSLLGRTLTVTRPGHVKERRELGDQEWVSSLAEVFGLSFTPEEAARLVARADGV
ncbi:MAG TPA: arylamine N-acetyltransferase [Trebonia sp.]|jgi:N-hydroxyarylamine O-acetyltransferase|nr:arylamine N-acetyltransferase [Trebonia sp.]